MSLDISRIHLDFRSKQPVFEQIADAIRAAIQSGECQPEDQLPTVRQMADDLKINFNTVARAYRVLDFEGWLSTQRGRGTYVIQPIFEKSEEAIQGESLDRIISEIKRIIETTHLPPDLILQNLHAAFQIDQSKAVFTDHPIYRSGIKGKPTSRHANKKAVPDPRLIRRNRISKKKSIKPGHPFPNQSELTK